jgi:hypothetical protein
LHGFGDSSEEDGKAWNYGYNNYISMEEGEDGVIDHEFNDFID